MTERPKLRMVGGTDYLSPEKPKLEVVSGSEKKEDVYDALITLWSRVTAELPEHENSVRQELIDIHAETVRSWSVEELYTALSRPDLWTRPSLTQAVIEEVALRMRAGNFSPYTKK